MLANNDIHCAFIGVAQLTFSGNLVHGTSGRTSGNTGLYIGTAAGQTQTGGTIISGNTFYNYAGPGGTGLAIGGASVAPDGTAVPAPLNVFCSGNSFLGNTFDVSDQGVKTAFVNTATAGTIAHVGVASSIPTTPAVFFGPITVQGPLSIAGTLFSAGGIVSTPIGNSGPSTGAFTTLAMQTGASYASDAAAASGGVAVGQLYRNGSALQVRVS